MSPPGFDVVVAGAGPAGSVAALVLARGGARVGLVDKAAFPRDKACGDLVGPRGVGLLDELGVSVPDAGQGADLLVVGPSGHRSRLPAFPGRAYPGHGVVIPRVVLDDALRTAAIEAGAQPIRARVSGLDRPPGGPVRALITSDGQRLAADAFVGADGALSPVARLAGMLDPGTALWGFAIRAYVPAEVPLPLLVLLDQAPWRIYPGYGWLFPGADGQANVGIGVGLGTRRRQARLRDDLARFVTLLRMSGDLAPEARIGPVTGGWLRMGGYRHPARGRQRAAGRGRRGADQSAAGRGHRARHGQRAAGRGVPAGRPGAGGRRLHRGDDRRVRAVPAGRRGPPGHLAAAPARGVGRRAAAHRARGPPGAGRYLVAVLERPGGRGQPAAGRVGRSRGAAGGQPRGTPVARELPGPG